MKQQNFKNSFQPAPLPDKSTNILSDTLTETVAQQLTELHSILHCSQEYNFSLGYRLIALHIHTGFNTPSLPQQIRQFLKHSLPLNNLESLRQCLDIILLAQDMQDDKMAVISQLWKIQVLQSLVLYYGGNRKEKKKCSFILRQLCRQTLGKETTRRQRHIREQILRIYLNEERRRMRQLMGRKKKFEALQPLNNMVRVLEKEEEVGEYQNDLMVAYWDLSVLHHELHYPTYAKKYARTALSIAERQQLPMAAEITSFLQSL